MYNFNILEVCVLRDIFNYVKDDSFSVKKYAQFISPYTFGNDTKTSIIKDREQLENYINNFDTSNFKKRNLKLDLDKTTFRFIEEYSADYLLIDVACCRYDLYYFPDKNIYTTKNDICPQIYNGNFLEYCELVNTDTLSDNVIEESLEKYCSNILSLYKPEQIILFDIKAVSNSLNKAGNIMLKGWDLAEKYNRRMKKAFDVVKNKLSGCHIVEFPNGILSDESHYLGFAVLHYIPEYYEYAHHALQIILNKLPFDVEKIALHYLRSDYEQKIIEKYNPLFNASLKRYADIEMDAKRRIKYVEYFKKLLLDEKKFENLVNYFRTNNISNCAFYGASEISRFLIDYLRKSLPDININYIVENSPLDKYNNTVPYISRNASSFPETDLIIISDVLYIDAIYKKLNNLKVTAKLTDVFSIIEK